MEADDFFSGYEALQDASRTIQLILRDPCPITRIVWSSFDHITGPELRFVWEVITAANLTPLALSTNSESTKDGSSSTTSSISRDTSSVAYEEIDDVLQVPDADRPHYLDEFMMESRSTLGGANTMTDDDDELARLMTSFASSSQFTEDEAQSDCTSRTEETADIDFFRWKKNSVKGGKAASSLSSPARPLDRTESGLSSGGKCTKPETVDFGRDPLTADHCLNNGEQSLGHLVAEKCRIDYESDTTPAAVSESEFQGSPVVQNMDSYDILNQHFAGADARRRSICTQNGSTSEDLHQALTTSAVDSGITGTVSAHSDLSVFCSSPPTLDSACYDGAGTNIGLLTSSFSFDYRKVDEGYIEDERLQVDSSDTFNESVDYDTLMEMSGESTTIQPSDDEFIAKLVLTDQVYSLQLPSSSLMHKINIVPKRRLLVGSHLFPVNRMGDNKCVTCAISVVTSDSMYEWYMKRQDVLEEMFTDIAPRLKASYYSESIDDVICRMRTEFERMLSALGAAERYSLCSSVDEFKMRQTYLFDPKLQENTFLAKAITGLLQSQSHCVVVGDHRKAVHKMLNTLSFFVPEEWRWCSLKPCRHPYSPYLRLQSIDRNELSMMITAGVEAHWPVAIIDVDKELVCVSSNYLKHRRLKQRRQKSDVTGILISAGVDVEISEAKQNKLEMRNCHSSALVNDFLARLDFLPYEQNARVGFIRQFLLGVENRARAFITYVQDISKPTASDKRSASSSRWSLNATRKALDLTSEPAFTIILAEAERLKTGIADFICDTRSV